MTVVAADTRSQRLIFVPMLLALAAMWGTLVWYTLNQRADVLERASTQLTGIAATLADFNELVEQSGTSDPASAASATRTAAIWRALLQYPTASIWVEKNGKLETGEPPAASGGKFLRLNEVREGFSVHVALPESDALAQWQSDTKGRSLGLLLVTGLFLLLGRILVRALRQRESAEREAHAAQERATQLADYRERLELTVAERTAELRQSNEMLGKELGERKAAEEALREHDALLHVVTKSAVALLESYQEESITTVLGLIGTTLGVRRVHLNRYFTDHKGVLRWSVAYEWCVEGSRPLIDAPELQNLDVIEHLGPGLPRLLANKPLSFFLKEVVQPDLRLFFEREQMRSFLQIPVRSADKLWGSIYFMDAADAQRKWTWAERDTLRTLANLLGVAIARARYVRELADANMIVQNSPTLLYRLRGEPSLPLIYVSHNIVKFGHDPAKLVASPNWAQTIVHPQDTAKVEASMARVLEKDAEPSTIEFRLLTGDGAFRWVENRYTPIRSKDGRLSEVEGIIIDITERKAAEEKIAQLARTDSLTNLANRATFTERLRQAFAASRRGASPFAILYIDLDHFKDVNDTLGHPVGDLLLREVADRLRTLTRDTDVVARLGGDEFAILQTEMGEPANAGALAGKIQKLLAQPYLIEGNNAHVSASIGVCPYVPGSSSPDTMLAQADLALYRSKDEGRNQWHFHTDDLDHEVTERVALAEELRDALGQGALELYYQPQVDVANGAILGMEALLRWNHPTRGLLSAGAFIPVAEKAGLMISLGHWVLDQACSQMQKWRAEGVAPAAISINLSLSQLKNSRELLRDVAETTAQYGLKPSDLEFDVTEATLAQATLTQNDVLTRLHELGARIAIDDFGTEYSSFDYLRSYHVSNLKIAQSFINGAMEDPERAATIRAIISIARELDIGVIAEGVETEGQRQMLAATGSMTSAQGYFFSAAVDVARANEMLRNGCTTAILPQLDEAEVADRLLTVRKAQG